MRVYLDEGVREAFDGHGPGQAGLTHVGGTPPFQLPLTSEQSLQDKTVIITTTEEEKNEEK